MFRRRGKNKYNNKILKHDGKSFASKKELERFLRLSKFQDESIINSLRFQVPYELLGGFVDNSGVRHRPIKYIADFVYVRASDGVTVIEDCKGYKTDIFRLKEKLLLSKLRDTPNTIFKVTNKINDPI